MKLSQKPDVLEKSRRFKSVNNKFGATKINLWLQIAVDQWNVLLIYVLDLFINSTFLSNKAENFIVDRCWALKYC